MSPASSKKGINEDASNGQQFCSFEPAHIYMINVEMKSAASSANYECSFTVFLDQTDVQRSVYPLIPGYAVYINSVLSTKR